MRGRSLVDGNQLDRQRSITAREIEDEREQEEGGEAFRLRRAVFVFVFVFDDDGEPEKSSSPIFLATSPLSPPRAIALFSSPIDSSEFGMWSESWNESGDSWSERVDLISSNFLLIAAISTRAV